MNARLRGRLAKGWSRADARSATWDEAEDEWHRRHGTVPDPDHCAGCGRLLIDYPGMPLTDGARVHLDAVHGLDCLVAYDVRCRGAARAGLLALGIKVPIERT
jgi:hypothetical protein